MVTAKNIGKTDDYVYDISLDGTVCGSMFKMMSNTDGF